jgi:hypothetical protein
MPIEVRLATLSSSNPSAPHNWKAAPSLKRPESVLWEAAEKVVVLLFGIKRRALAMRKSSKYKGFSPGLPFVGAIMLFSR